MIYIGSCRIYYDFIADMFCYHLGVCVCVSDLCVIIFNLIVQQYCGSRRSNDGLFHHLLCVCVCLDFVLVGHLLRFPFSQQPLYSYYLHCHHPPLNYCFYIERIERDIVPRFEITNGKRTSSIAMSLFISHSVRQCKGTWPVVS